MKAHAGTAMPLPAVLLVDDDQDIRTTYRLIIEDAGYDVLQAQDGMQALDILHAQPAPLIVLTNHHMPRLDGPGLLRQVLEDPALVAGHVYVYMTAGSRDLSPALDQVLAALHAPALFKPIRGQTLLAALADATRRLSTEATFGTTATSVLVEETTALHESGVGDKPDR